MKCCCQLIESGGGQSIAPGGGQSITHVTMIEFEYARELARDELQGRFTGEMNVSLLEHLPGATYTIGKFVPEDWLIFAASDPAVRQVGGSQCVAVHRQTGEVLSLGMVGE